MRAGQPDTGETLVIDYQPAEEAVEAKLRDATSEFVSAGARRFTLPLRTMCRSRRRRPSSLSESTTGPSSTNSFTPREHESRLNWSRKDKDKTYAFGELIAELGGVFVCRELGVPASDDLTNHIAYLGNWLQAMKNDSRFIIMAMCTGQQSRFLHPLVQQERGRSASRRRRTGHCLTSCGNGVPPPDTAEQTVPIGDNRTGTPEPIKWRLGFSNQHAA